MAFVQRPNSGSLFKNDRKEQPNHPDMQGDAEIDGKPYRISAWTKEGKRGKFLSLAFKPKEDGKKFENMRQAAGTPAAPAAAQAQEPDDLPF